MFCESAAALSINLGTNWIRNRGDLMLRWELCRILMRDYDRSHVKSADILRPATPQQLLVSVAIALLGHQRRLFLSNPLEIRPYNHTFHLTLTFLPFFFHNNQLVRSSLILVCPIPSRFCTLLLIPLSLWRFS